MVQAHEKQPIIKTEDLQPKDTIAGYKFTWEERGLIAWAELEPIDDQPVRGFILTWGYDTVSGREPGQRQRGTGTTLVSKVRELMIGQMVIAGWAIMDALERKNIWQHHSRIVSTLAPEPTTNESDQAEPVKKAKRRKLDPSQGTAILNVSAQAKVKDYRRTIIASEVTYTCARCGCEVTKLVFPGKKPQWCEDCLPMVKHAQMRARVQRYRTNKKEAKAASL